MLFHTKDNSLLQKENNYQKNYQSYINKYNKIQKNICLFNKNGGGLLKID
jgi:hypothetical protein